MIIANKYFPHWYWPELQSTESKKYIKHIYNQNKSQLGDYRSKEFETALEIMDQKEQSPPKKEDSALIKQIKGSGLQYRTKNLVQNFETLMH